MADEPKPTDLPIFLGWGRDLATRVAERLIQAAPETNGVMDMGSHLVIVPAPMAGRLIEEALVSARPNGLLIPRFTTPSNFLNQLDDGVGATEADAIMAWIEVLGSINRADYKALFPIENPAAMSPDEVKQLAWTLMSVRDALGETPDGHNMASVAALPDLKEKARWDDLMRLEGLYLDVLGKRGLADHNDRRRRAATAPKAPANITHIWLACVAEPQPIVITALGHLAEASIQVQALVGAEAEAGAFDDWGRPVAAHWLGRRSDWKDFEQRVHAVGNPTAGLALVGRLIGAKAPTPGTVALCACDREADSPRLATLIGTLGGKAVDPLGRTHASSGLHHALRAWSAFLVRGQSPTFAEVRAALRAPEIIAGLAGGKADNAYTEVNRGLDRLDAKGQGGDLAHLLTRDEVDAALRKALEGLEARRREHLDLSPCDSLRKAMRELVGTRTLRQGKEDEAYLLDVLDDLDETAGALQPGAGDTLDHRAFFALALELAGESRFRWSDGAEAVNLPGWLEAPWEPVPHLVLFGLNDHVVPRSRNADPFLPGPLRTQLGLPSNEDTFAAAALALEQIRRRRAAPGTRYDIVVPLADDEGSPLRPSRLLFLGDPSDQPARVQRLFGESGPTEAAPYWQIQEEHRLDPRRPEGREGWPVDHLSASSIASYLASPADFWLEKALGLGRSTFGAAELDNAAFGILVHLALQRWGEANKGKSPKPTELKQDKRAKTVARVRAEMLDLLGQAVRELYGEKPSGTILIQEQMAAERISRFAEDQVGFWADGWVIDQVEFDFGSLKLDAEGMPLEGRIDRIDRRGSGAATSWRLLDYKTSSAAKEPTDAHLDKAGKQADFLTPDKESRWIGVQLPLYLKAWEKKLGAEKNAGIAAGYINLASQTGEEIGATLELWDELTPRLIDSAWSTIGQVAALVRSQDPAHWRMAGEKEFPLLPALAGRPLEDWMDVTGLGEVRR